MRSIRPILAVALAALALGGGLAPPAAAAGAVDELRSGPALGMAAAAIIAARDQSGTPQSFGSLRGKRGLVLMFSRSFDW